MFALTDKWIWDFWLAHDEAKAQWHMYFLHADKALIDPNLRHWNVKIGHAVSANLCDWDYLGVCFQPAQIPAWDDKTTWTGSVIQAPDGLWHLFYTGTSNADNGLKQRIGHATSSDMHSWERVGNGLALDIDTHWYEEYDVTKPHWPDRAMRDPWVMPDPKGDGWLMYFTARVPNVAEPNAGGAIGLARSINLYDWQPDKPVFSGGFGQLEVPQVLELNGRWYCLFCTDNKHWSQGYAAENQPAVTGTHYLIAEHPEGPWQIAPGEFLDGSQPPTRYAGKLVRHDEQLWLMGFLHDDAQGHFVGAVSDPILMMIDERGLLLKQ